INKPEKYTFFGLKFQQIISIMMANMVNICICDGEGGEVKEAPSCTAKPNGSYCYPGDPNKRILCLLGILLVTSCPPDQEFNCKSKMCGNIGNPNNCKGDQMTPCL
ncbi:hypothetical protein B4U80_14232, partial [Leptotrombidium deliense]